MTNNTRPIRPPNMPPPPSLLDEIQEMIDPTTVRSVIDNARFASSEIAKARAEIDKH